jgi:flagellum-specific peptidoglycan hydrolase FlgJ
VNKQDFLKLAVPAAQGSSLVSLLPSGVTVAQAAIESAWGEHAPGNNFFGITGHGDLNDIPLESHEVLTDAQLVEEMRAGRILKIIGNGTAVPGTARKRYLVERNFGAWSTMAANFMARDHMISTYPVYAAAYLAWIHDHDIETYVRGFATHWATDPNYAETILTVYRQNGLAEYDKETA